MDSQNVTNRGLAMFGVIAGLSLVLVAGIVSLAVYRVKALSDVISVTGSAQKNITSDTVKWRVSVSRNTNPQGLKDGNALIQKDVEAVRSFLRENGVADSEVTVKPVSIATLYASQSGYVYQGSPEYAGGSEQVVGYVLRQALEINSMDVAKITAVAQNSGQLINQGILFSNDSLEYFYSKLADLKVEMLAAATEDAKLRTERIAQSAGSQVGSVRAASMGVFQVTALNSAEVSDYGIFDTSSIEKQITAVVHGSFSLR